jgi:hypothetical protein
MLPQAFNLIQHPHSGQPNTGSHPPADHSDKVGTPGSQSPALNATAPEFKPGTQE